MRTLDPNDADLFYVPLLSYYGPAQNVNTDGPKAPRLARDRAEMRVLIYADDRGVPCACTQAQLAIAYIRARYGKFWERHGGRDHVFFTTVDKGANAWGWAAATPVVMSHWGLVGPWQAMRWQYSSNSRKWYNRSAHALAHEIMVPGHMNYAPHKDIVVPAYVGQAAGRYDERRGAPLDLIHSGGIWGWNNKGPHKISAYSLGMRQRLWELYGVGSPKQAPRRDRAEIAPRSRRDRAAPRRPPVRSQTPRLLILNRTLRGIVWRTTKFCYSPAGDGWGIRVGKALAGNCLPLVAQPSVVQPFEEVSTTAAAAAAAAAADAAAAHDEAWPISGDQRRSRLYLGRYRHP